MKTKYFLLSTILLAVMPFIPAYADDSDAKMNYPDHAAKKLDVCPFVRITDFDFKTSYVYREGYNRAYRYSWKNEGTKAVTAFQLHILRFDPFDDLLIGLVNTVPGHDSANFTPLNPGESDGDGSSESGDSDLYTALIYVRKVRFTDGTIWEADPAVLNQQILKAMPVLKADQASKAQKKLPAGKE